MKYTFKKREFEKIATELFQLGRKVALEKNKSQKAKYIDKSYLLMREPFKTIKNDY